MEKVKLCERGGELSSESLYAVNDGDGWRLLQIKSEYLRHGAVFTELRDLLASEPWDVVSSYVKSEFTKEYVSSK